MSTRLSRLLVEARLYLYLLGGSLVLHLWLPLLAALCLGSLVWARSHGYPVAEPLAGAILVFVLASPFWLSRSPVALPRTIPDPAVRDSLELYPTLKQVAEQTARELGKEPPTRVLFRLSPVFRHWGAQDDPDDRELGSRTLRVDLSRAGLCSVFEFRCDLAKATLQPRMPRWFSRRVLAQIDHLAARMERGPTGLMAVRRWGWCGKLREGELNALRAWRLFAEMETDRALAATFGKRCVASWIEKSWFAEWVFPVYQQIWLEPAWQRGYLPPTMEGFRRFHDETGSHWLIDTDADRPVNLDSRYELSEIARWQPHRMRLLALNAAEESAASVYDTRPASLLLADGGAEEKVVRRASALHENEALDRISWAEYPEKVILAEIDDMIHEEGDLFKGRTLPDLPALIQEGSHMVYEMVHMPFLPPQFEDRLAAMPNALGGFLIKNLLARGWQMQFDLVRGLTLDHPETKQAIDPNSVVQLLAEGAMTEEEFQHLVGLRGGPSRVKAAQPTTDQQPTDRFPLSTPGA